MVHVIYPPDPKPVPVKVKKLPKPKKKPRPPLIGYRNCAVMAAILGVSNCGMDSLFRGKFSPVTTKTVTKYTTHDPEEVAWDFCNLFAESEEMAQPFVEEAAGWFKKLRRMSSSTIKKTWPDYAPFLEALEEA